MRTATMHPQDVLAQIRKAYRSAAAFERAHNLPPKSVNSTIVRGFKSARVTKAIEDFLQREHEQSRRSADANAAHRINAEAR